MKPARFIGRLNIKTPAGYSQVLEVAFEPSIASQIEELSQTENTVRLERINVMVTKMMAPVDQSMSKRKAGQGGDFKPYFVNEVTTMTVGGSGGRFFGPWNPKPTADDFVTSRTVANNRTWSLNGQASLPGTGGGGMNYTQSTAISDLMIARSIGLDFIDWASAPGCKSWKYKIKPSYQTELEFSLNRPPVHEAMLWYDATSDANFPTYLITNVESDFRKNRGFRYQAAILGFKNAIFRFYLRHISLHLEARIKRMEPEDFYQMPNSQRKGAILIATLVFEEVEANGDKLQKYEKTLGVDTDLVPSF